jgi:hypothetical protein
MMAQGKPHNPFSSERIRPGALTYLTGEGESVDDLIDRLEGTGFRGQIVGPHGTGKSTLLAVLAAELARRGKVVHLLEARGSGRIRIPKAGVLLIDSAERLSRTTQKRLAAISSRDRCGLVVTAHEDMGLPTLARTEVPPGMARRIVTGLLERWDVEPPSQAVLTDMLQRHGGNMRHVLFELYDWFERQVC